MNVVVCEKNRFVVIFSACLMTGPAEWAGVHW